MQGTHGDGLYRLSSLMGTEAVPGPDNEHVLKTDDGKKKHGTDYSRRSCGDKYAHAGLLLLRRPFCRRSNRSTAHTGSIRCGEIQDRKQLRESDEDFAGGKQFQSSSTIYRPFPRKCLAMAPRGPLP